jgi:hypothetical protein
VIKLDENAFKPGMLSALQPLHANLKRGDIDFEDGKRALIHLIRTYAAVPKIGEELVVQVDRHAKDEAALIRSIETLLLIMGGTPQAQALSAVAETSEEDPDMDKDMQELKSGSKYMGICPICKKPITGKTDTKEADKIEYWHGKKAHAECVAAEKETAGKEKEPEPAAVTETMSYESMDAALQKLEAEEEATDQQESGESFSRQHYNVVANLLKTANDKDEIAAGLADLFASDNPRFDRERFFKAAGISLAEEEETEKSTAQDLHDRMVAKAKDQFKSSEFEGLDFDIEAAIYWLASDYHGGQSSPLYSILSTSEFKPGPSHSSVDDEGEIAKEIYDMLAKEFAREIK